MLALSTGSTITHNRLLAQKYTRLAVLLKKSGLTTSKFEINDITHDICIKLKSIKNILPTELNKILQENLVFEENFNRENNWIQLIVEEIQSHKSIITLDPQNKTENGNIWEEEYKTTLKEPWAVALLKEK